MVSQTSRFCKSSLFNFNMTKSFYIIMYTSNHSTYWFFSLHIWINFPHNVYSNRVDGLCLSHGSNLYRTLGRFHTVQPLQLSPGVNLKWRQIQPICIFHYHSKCGVHLSQICFCKSRNNYHKLYVLILYIT